MVRSHSREPYRTVTTPRLQGSTSLEYSTVDSVIDVLQIQITRTIHRLMVRRHSGRGTVPYGNYTTTTGVAHHSNTDNTDHTQVNGEERGRGTVLYGNYTTTTG
ncbi:hypothetical protein J6590_036485 [Homalodisca vitripennis]|nr:hypothetical protein J6590_036485 [Homalodisca vitripennis]